VPAHAERRQDERHGEERREPAQRHQTLEREVVDAAGKRGGREEDGERTGRILDEEVAVGKLAAQEPVGVDAVQMHIPIALRPEQASVGDCAGHEEDGRRQAGDAGGGPRRARAGWTARGQAAAGAGRV
jgi:hypothetical protein